MGKKKKSTEEEQPQVDEAGESVESSSPESETPAKPEKKEDEILLFGKWSSDVELRDKGLERYLNTSGVS